ncbi:MAG: V-type ATP synthase subunit D [Firmicutes bacterium]|nr:V-type ATP synthase subunit D [Bacillota bacterium]HAL63780.1 V-type ATP synthase subunit D [Clostridiales bacterium]
MAELNVNPTRMELARIKKSLAVATKGHRLLKDKRDELMRQFLNIMREAKDLREEVEEGLKNANKSLAIASSLLQREVINSALLLPKQEVLLDVTKRNIMSVDVPVFSAKMRTSQDSDIFSYGYAFTGGDLDFAISSLAGVLPQMLRLSELEKSAEMLAGEIERTRRRVNALEYVMIPDYRDTIKRITMKLDEAERSNTVRLMKVKDMMIAENIASKRGENA